MGDNERSGTDDRDEVQRRLDRFSDPQSVDEYCDLLQKEILVLPVLSHDPRVLESAGSVIWHTDLHLGNIYVSSDDPTTIEGFPEFLRPPKNYSTGTEIPSLPENFEELDPDQKERVAEEQTLAAQSKYYEMSCLAYNKPIYDAMKLDRRLWEPFHMLPALLEWLHGSSTKLSGTTISGLGKYRATRKLPIRVHRRRSSKAQRAGPTLFRAKLSIS
ncbi:hypothetical protein KXV96_000920 [Aspergillus fumigatus]|nr:hypothetical protein KXV96_000920 [Aspergillus fumigatus]